MAAEWPAGAYAACALCPRRCGVDRTTGASGYCRGGIRPEVFRFGAHHGEEPPVSGTRGSGTVFFSRCTLRCLYCQNHPWSQEGQGRATDAAGLTAMLERLRDDGCHNWNLVSPTPWWPSIVPALDEAARTGPRLPVVCNTSGYERVETVRALRGVVDVWLTDLRYAEPESAREGSDASDYVGVARAALGEMWRQAGPLRLDREGLAVAGVICRLLVLPGREDEAVDNLRWLAAETGTGIAVSVMAQYTPAHRAVGRPPWDRPVAEEEYRQVCAAVEALGFGEGWVQEWSAPAPDGLLGCTMPAGGPADVGCVNSCVGT